MPLDDLDAALRAIVANAREARSQIVTVMRRLGSVGISGKLPGHVGAVVCSSATSAAASADAAAAGTGTGSPADVAAATSVRT